jgi:hypothetical protein
MYRTIDDSNQTQDRHALLAIQIRYLGALFEPGVGYGILARLGEVLARQPGAVLSEPEKLHAPAHVSAKVKVRARNAGLSDVWHVQDERGTFHLVGAVRHAIRIETHRLFFAARHLSAAFQDAKSADDADEVEESVVIRRGNEGSTRFYLVYERRNARTVVSQAHRVQTTVVAAPKARCVVETIHVDDRTVVRHVARFLADCRTVDKGKKTIRRAGCANDVHGTDAFVEIL